MRSFSQTTQWAFRSRCPTFDRRGVLQNEANFRSEAGFLLGAAMPTFSLAAGGEA
jgi:hypothetical protein